MYKQTFLSTTFYLYKPIVLEFRDRYRGIIALDFDNAINEKIPINPCKFRAPIVKYVGDYPKNNEEQLYRDLLAALDEYSKEYPICVVDEPDDSLDDLIPLAEQSPKINFPFDINKAVSFNKTDFPTIESVRQMTYKKLKNMTLYLGGPLYHAIKYKLLDGIAANNIYETDVEFIGYWQK